jgi:formylglycine-generating enzyme required for sulfatase activity
MGGGSEEGPPTKQVTINNDFELAAYTVTQGQWEAVMGVGSNPSYFSREGKGSASVLDVSIADLRRFPVEMVSWYDVQKFVEKLNEREMGKSWTYRLPKEAEWEYACRGSAGTAGTSKEECSFDFYFAKGTNDLSSDQSNFDGEFPGGNGAKGKSPWRTTQVGQYQPNRLGLHDMHGNVWQWCEDSYDGKGPDKVFRGGSWLHAGLSCRAAFRCRSAPSHWSSYLGFRVARIPSGS